VLTTPFGERPARVGRAASNEVVVSDTTVSAHHLLAWREAGTHWVKDLGSTNGTFLNDKRIWSAHPVNSGDRVRLGTSCELEIRTDERGVVESRRGRVVEDRFAGVRHPVTEDRFTIGPTAFCDVVVPDAPLTTLTFHADGEIWRGNEVDEGPLAVSEDFLVGERSFRVLDVEDVISPTEVPRGDRYPYRLRATLEGAFGAEAVVETLDGKRTCAVRGDNRAILLYLLARKFADDGQNVPERRGWVPDDEMMSGIWGRHGDENKLNVLLHRLRAELRQAGFDPWFIEKKQRLVRLRVAEVVLQ
jgi:hypothetical protein